MVSYVQCILICRCHFAAPPVDDKVNDEMSHIIIPTTQTHESHEMIEVPASLNGTYGGYETNDHSSMMGVSSALSSKIMIANEVFKYISGRSTSDHPMCQDCANIVIQSQEKVLNQTKSELEALENYLKTLENYENQSIDKEDDELLLLEKEEQDLLIELKNLQIENEKLDREIEEEQAKLDVANIEYDKVVMHYNNKKQILWDLEDDIRSLNQRKKYFSFLAERLKRTNLLNVLFPIWYEDHFATINGFRMGRLTEVNVEWPEINAGFGQCVLLLHNIVIKMNMTLENYKLVPCGSSSYIETLKDKKRYLLCKSGGYNLIPNNKFDQAMTAYLDCLHQVITRIETHDPNFKFPYRVKDKHKLEEYGKQGYSIKLLGNSDENWTKALKFMLINLKWITTWMVKASFKQYCDSAFVKQQSMP